MQIRFANKDKLDTFLTSGGDEHSIQLVKTQNYYNAILQNTTLPSDIITLICDYDNIYLTLQCQKFADHISITLANKFTIFIDNYGNIYISKISNLIAKYNVLLIDNDAGVLEWLAIYKLGEINGKHNTEYGLEELMSLDEINPIRAEYCRICKEYKQEHIQNSLWLLLDSLNIKYNCREDDFEKLYLYDVNSLFQYYMKMYYDKDDYFYAEYDIHYKNKTLIQQIEEKNDNYEELSTVIFDYYLVLLRVINHKEFKQMIVICKLFYNLVRRGKMHF